MKTHLACIPCLARQALDAVTEAVPDPARREPLLRRLLREIADGDWAGSPPALAQRLQRAIREALGDADPYRAIKDRMNEMAARLVPALRARIAAHPDPREAAVRVAIGGNLLDVGAKTQIAAEDLPAHLEAIWDQPLRGDVAGLFAAAERAESILYLADNAGEIVFDRLLIEHLPAGKVAVAVRGAPVLNDATRADAETAGIPAVAPVIAKGQGNYETLAEEDKNLYFLFTVKCPLVAARVGEPVGRLVARRQRRISEEPR